MGPESWTVIGTGIVILIAIAASNRSLRHAFNTRLTHLEADLGGRLSDLEGELKSIELQLRERLAKLEGLFGGMRESILDRNAR